MLDSVVYRDTLPDGCPPEIAEVIDGARIFYRVTRSPIDPAEDFKSFRQESSMHKSSTIDECIANGLTVYATLEAAENTLRHHRDVGKSKKWQDKESICMLELTAGAGAILRTQGGQPADRGEHWTWWPARKFNIHAHAKSVKALPKEKGGQ